MTQPQKDKIMPSAATWVSLEIVILSEVSQTQKNKYIAYYVDSKKNEYKKPYLQNRSRVIDIEKNMVTRGQGWDKLEIEIDIYTLPYMKLPVVRTCCIV